MKLSKKLIILAVPALFAVSCKKFLDVKPKGVIIAETVGDYEALLNGSSIVNPFGLSNGIINATDDRWAKTFSTQNNTIADVNLYFWREYINNTGDKRPDVWADFYNNIANLNAVTEGVLSATDGTPQKKAQLYAEAMVDKAFVYFHLLSFFSPAYEKATATTNFGVPYVTSTDVSEATPPRPTLQQSYDHIITDITAAIPHLPETNSNNTRVTKSGAYALLARTYLSMGDYVNAEKYTDLVLASNKATLLDYNEFIGMRLPLTNSSPEELWVRYSNNVTFTYSKDLVANYDVDNDLRFRFFARKDANAPSYSFGSTAYNPNRGITYAEVFLTKAECLARRGDIDGALQIINDEIRMKRIDAAGYEPLTATTKEEALSIVLLERRRELAFKGTRWSDMKRLDAEGKMPAVQRLAADGVTVLETLEPGSTKYTFQIPLAVQAFNPKMPLNKR